MENESNTDWDTIGKFLGIGFGVIATFTLVSFVFVIPAIEKRVEAKLLAQKEDE